MSRRNREKRAAKQKQPAPGGEPRRGAARFWLGADRVDPRRSWSPPSRAAARCRCGDVGTHAGELLAEFGPAGRELDLAADSPCSHAIRAAWEAGWSAVGPARAVPTPARTAGRPASCCQAIVVESRRYAGATLHPAMARRRRRRSRPGSTTNPDAQLLRGWAARTCGIPARRRWPCCCRCWPRWRSCRSLERLLPLPGARRHAIDPAAEVDQKVLAKVRALLAKAESTEFPDEAEALSAKAQELMSRYSLHQAVHEHDRGRAPAAAGRRLWMDAPYAGAKALLVQAVATANRCRTVWSAEPGLRHRRGRAGHRARHRRAAHARRCWCRPTGRCSRPGGQVTPSRHVAHPLVPAVLPRRLRDPDRRAARCGRHATAAAAQAREDAGLLPVLAARSRAADEMIDRLFPTHGASVRSGVERRGLGCRAGRRRPGSASTCTARSPGSAPAGVLSVPVGSLAAVALALYRKYRPAKFAEVVGQEHVTEPLSTALAAGRINHAYLFSGPAGLRQDLQRADPGPLAQLRAGPHPRAVRRLPVLRLAGPGRAGQHRRHRARRGLARRCRRHPRAARPGVLRAGRVALPGVHRRRGAHDHHAGLQRPAQDRGGAAGAPGVRVRDHRAGQGAAHHPLPHPPLPVPADPAGHAAQAAGADLRRGGRGRRPGGVPAGHPGRRRLGARLAVGARPAAGRGRAGGRHLRAGGRAARRHRRRR